MTAVHIANYEKYRIHFTDNYGQATIECHSTEEYEETLKNIQEDPMCEGIWTEFYDEEEGWQA